MLAREQRAVQSLEFPWVWSQRYTLEVALYSIAGSTFLASEAACEMR